MYQTTLHVMIRKDQWNYTKSGEIKPHQLSELYCQSV